VAEKISELDTAGRLEGQQLEENQPAHLEKKPVESIVPMQLDLAKRAIVKGNRRDRPHPPEECPDGATNIAIEVTTMKELEKRGFHNLVWEDIGAQLVKLAMSAPLIEG
jgi:hypothetical protein